MVDVDPFVNGDDAFLRDAVGEEDLPDRVGRGHVTVDLSIFPSRERIALQVKIDPARGDERRSAAFAEAAKRQRDRRHCDAVRIVGVDDVRPKPLEDAGEPPAGSEVDFGARRQRDQLEAFRGAPPQLPVGMGDERRSTADRPQTVDGQKNLILPAAPSPRGVYVQREHE